MSSTPKWEDTEPVAHPKWEDTQEATAPSQGEAVLHGLEQGSTMGFFDEAQGGLEAGGQALGLKGLGGPMQNISFMTPNGVDMEKLKQAYLQRRDQVRAEQDASKQAFPKTAMASELAGGLLTGGIAGAPKTLGTAALTGTAMGAATGLGTTNAPLLSKETAMNTGIGGALGAAGGAAGYGVSKLLSPEARQAAANIRASKALGLKAEDANVGAAALKENVGLNMFGGAKGNLNNVTGRMTDIEQGLVQPNLQAAAENSGFNNSVMSGLEEGKIQPINKMIDDVVNSVSSKIPDVPESEGMAQAIEKQALHWGNKLEAANNDPFKLNEIRKEIDAYAKASKPTVFNADRTDLTPKYQFLTELRDKVNEQLRTISSIISPGAGEQITGGMQRQSRLFPVKEAVEGLVQKDINNPVGFSGLGVKDIGTELAGGAMALAGHTTLGPATMAAGLGKVGAETLTGQPISRLANIASAKTQNAMASGLRTSIGKNITATGVALTKQPIQSTGVQSSVHRIFNTGPQGLQQAADVLSKSKSTQYLGQAIGNASDSEDADSKLAIAMQNPYARNALSGVGTDKVNEFLDKTAMTESSGGTNFNHEPITSGSNAGQTAIGTYGLLPETVKEVVNRSKDNKLSYLNDMDYNTLKAHLESNPDIEKQVARYLAQRVLKNQGGDLNKAYYAWRHGHNLSSETVEDKYQDDPDVQRFSRQLANKE